jgi:hypothetical protein
MTTGKSPMKASDERVLNENLMPIATVTAPEKEQQKQEQVLYVVRARLQVVEDLLMSGG